MGTSTGFDQNYNQPLCPEVAEFITTHLMRIITAIPDSQVSSNVHLKQLSERATTVLKSAFGLGAFGKCPLKTEMYYRKNNVH